ncbi:VanW family protein [Amycolatopsis acidiphila]|uniref:Vanomycin resistance protein VanB n=1 Tax=Amycolatopsis acidiphila TaxID=715473 RepID=A0A558A6S9_9PSEU|nr:VanW family protein [Amycolatopsis acidiphila]TVT19961.1 vanomycin resistance protein VanB [Amycolatopsis acidiphila]UIJ60045.1 VanW family protein [Amycolatopsis acidiphila]GHG61673.1 vanomycin resistance protein VanB [Amycolatopsis acidiphila]
MREEHYWPDWDFDDQPTERIIGPQTSPEFLAEEPLDAHEDALVEELLQGDRKVFAPRSAGKRFLARVLMVTGGVLIVGVVLYAVDLLLSAGEVPRGVVVAGVEVGGLSRADAEAKLRRELEPRLTEPVPVVAGDVRTSLDPVHSGLGLDWPSTLAQAGHQPLDPLARIRSFFTKRDVEVVTTVDPDSLSRSVGRLASDQLDHPPTEGSIGFRPAQGNDGGVSAFAIEPRAGQTLTDVPGAASIVKARWLDKSGVRLPVDLTPVKATSAGVHAALDTIVRPAVAKPVVVHGDGADGVLQPIAISAAMRFVARADGGLDVRVDPAKLQQNLQPQLSMTEKPGKDAQIVFAGGAPVVQPSEDARRIDWTDTLKPLMTIFVKADGREVPVRYQTQKPKLSTDDANALGVKEVVGEFSTGGLSGAAASNVQAMAAKVNGALLKPGETFSLLARTGSFGSGFVPAPVNEDGTGPVVRGGGVSQFATTLYNAEYFAGLADAGHSEHPYYLDRYPPARDATAIGDDGSPVDLKFTDNLASGVAIQAYSSGSTVTVRIWGTRKYRVESSTGPRTNFTPPPIQPAPPGCQRSPGSVGFSTSDTRVLYDLASGAEVRRDSRAVTYAPRAAVIC